MPTLFFTGRTLLLAAALAASALAPAAAQTFRLIDPALSVDGRRVGVVGAPLVQEPFGVLVLSVPGSGTYRVATVPFDGARPVGQFDGDGLFFAVDGRSVRLRSSEAMLPGAAPAAAFVRFDPSDTREARSLARVAVASSAPALRLPERRRADLPARTEPARLNPPAREALDARTDAERRRLELDRLGGLSPQTGTVRGADARDTDRREAIAERLALEQQSLLALLAEAQASRDALQLQVEVLQGEREALRERVDRLETALAGAQGQEGALAGQPLPAPLPDGVASFPGFDFGRLQNPDTVRRRLDEVPRSADAMEGRRGGDVLVLFQTDRDGRVIRTAVASPLGGGLDGLAEALVREMRFVPPVVDGLPTGLRSQVLVRFEM